MENLKKNILKNYRYLINKVISDVFMKKGYVKTSDGIILQLNVFDESFTMIYIENIIDALNVYVPNTWNIPKEVQEKIITDIMLHHLPVLEENEIHNYMEYFRISKMFGSKKDLDKKAKLLLDDNKKRHKAVFKGGYHSPQYQAQSLINRDVFYYNQGYYIFDESNKRFVKLSPKTILKYIQQDFNNADINEIDVRDYMQTQYLFFVTESDFPMRYNSSKEQLRLLKDYKKDYEKVKEIIKGFE